MRVVVLGAGGLLGRHLRARLERTHEVRAFSHVECDIGVAATVRRQIEGCDAVVNCAAFTNVDGAETDEALAMRVNADGAAHVARAAVAVGAKVLHVSTDFVFDGEQGRPYEIGDPPAPLSVYGRSKYEGERRVWAEAERAFVVRVQAMYGVGGTGFSSRMGEIIAKGARPRIDAERRVQPSFVVPVADMLARIVESDRFGTYHVSCRGETTWADFAARLCARARIAPAFEAVPTSSLPAPARRPRNCVFSHHALSEAGFGEMPSWQDALDEYLLERDTHPLER